MGQAVRGPRLDWLLTMHVSRSQPLSGATLKQSSG